MNLIFILFLIYLKIQNGEESFFKIKNIALIIALMLIQQVFLLMIVIFFQKHKNGSF